MAATWSVKFIQDTVTPGVGTVTAFNDGLAYSARLDTNDTNAVDAFVLAAKAALVDQDDDKTENNAIAAAILTKLEAV